jgi:hypothetical protein
MSLCRHLKNDRLERVVFGLFSGLSFSNYFKIDERDSCDRTVIASHFYSYSTEELCTLSIESLCEILSSDTLIVQNEDSLLDLISTLEESYYSLLDYVRFEFLSVKGL